MKKIFLRIKRLSIQNKVYKITILTVMSWQSGNNITKNDLCYCRQYVPVLLYFCFLNIKMLITWLFTQRFFLFIYSIWNMCQNCFTLKIKLCVFLWYLYSVVFCVGHPSMPDCLVHTIFRNNTSVKHNAVSSTSNVCMIQENIPKLILQFSHDEQLKCNRRDWDRS
jgi:hypothetical protein